MALNRQSKHNGTTPRRHSYLLNGGLLSCGECGGTMEGRCGTGSKGTKHYYYQCRGCGFRIPAGQIERVLIERIQTLAQSDEILEGIVAVTNERLQEDLPRLTEQQRALEKDLAEVNETAEGLMDQWEALAHDEGTVFLKERLDALGKRRKEIEDALGELGEAASGVDREAVDHIVVAKALEQFTDVFEGMAPYQQKELVHLVVHDVTVSKTAMELGLFGKMPRMRPLPHTRSRSQTSKWLPGLATSRTPLTLLTEAQAARIHEFEGLVA